MNILPVSNNNNNYNRPNFKAIHQSNAVFSKIQKKIVANMVKELKTSNIEYGKLSPADWLSKKGFDLLVDTAPNDTVELFIAKKPKPKDGNMIYGVRQIGVYGEDRRFNNLDVKTTYKEMTGSSLAFLGTAACIVVAAFLSPLGLNRNPKNIEQGIKQSSAIVKDTIKNIQKDSIKNLPKDSISLFK